MNSQPSNWILKLLERIIHPDYRDEVLGDLVQEYLERKEKGQPTKFWIFWVSLGYIRHFNLLKMKNKPSTVSSVFWRNYLIVSFRNLLRHKRYSAISILGLVVGFASSIAILQYTSYESGYDSFVHSDIKRATHVFNNNSGAYETAYTFMAMEEAVREQVPEVADITNFLVVPGNVKIDEEVFVEPNIINTSSSFFEVFQIEMLSGSPEVIDGPNFILISESIARKYFDEVDVVGNQVELQGVFGQDWQVEIGGVFQDIPQDSHLAVDIVVPREKMLNIWREGNFFGAIDFQDIPWRLLGFHTYMRLQEQAESVTVEAKINEIIDVNRRVINEQLNQKHEIWLQPVQTIHTTSDIRNELKPTNDPSLLLLFSLIAFFILAIAWVNYINLSTARSITRGKEVGIRKVLGGHKGQLRMQFMVEATLINCIAVILSFVVLWFAAPTLEELINVPFFQDIFSNTSLIIMMVIVLMVGTIISGFYPAFVLSEFRILDVLQGRLKNSSGGIWLRRVLVVFQFMFAIFLIAGLLIVQSQMQFMMNADLGVSIDETYLMDLPGNVAGEEGYESRVNTFRNELNQIPGVEGVSVSSMVPGIENQFRSSTEQRTGEGAGIFIHRVLIDEEYLDLYELNLIAGRNVSDEFNDGTSLIVNETTLESLGYANPEAILNEKIYFAGQEYEVVGVISDFYQRGIHFAHEPMSFQFDTLVGGGFLSVKFSGKTSNDQLISMEETFREHFSQAPYNGRFLENVFLDQYEAEFRFRNLFSLFCGIALLISCLGLVGLSSYLINHRMREVGIRKVLGATGLQLFALLNKEYLIIGSIAFLIASPAIYLLSPMWLENFENRITVHPGYYLLPITILAGVIIITTLGHTLRAISVNPSKTLKED